MRLRNSVVTSRAGLMLKAPSDHTPHEAGVLVDLRDRGRLKSDIDDDVYDDLMLVASGHAALVRAADGMRRKTATCTQCGATFEPLRVTAMYCSGACKKRAARSRQRPSNASARTAA